MGKNSAPPPPPIDPAQTALMNKQSQALDYYLQAQKGQDTQNAQYQNLLKAGSGLYTPVYDAQGNITDTTFDKEAFGRLQAQNAVNDQASALQSDYNLRALKGELPVSEGTQQQYGQAFNNLQQGLAQRGASVSGTSLDNAVALDSQGAENLSRLRKEYALVADAERHAALGAGSGQPIGLGYAGQALQYGPGAGAGTYGQLGQLYGQAQQPYQQQQALQYQSSLQSAANAASNRAGIYQLAGTGLGAAATLAATYYGGPLAGAGVGAASAALNKKYNAPAAATS